MAKRRAKPWLGVIDWIASLFGASIAYWILVGAVVAYIYVVGFVQDLSGRRLLLLVPGLGLLALGLWGVYGDLKERARLKRVAEAKDAALTAIVNDLHLRKLLEGRPIPEWSLINGSFVFDLREVAFEYGTRFRVAVRDPNGRVRATTVHLVQHILSRKDHIVFEGRVRYPDDFGPRAQPVVPGEWEVIWRSELGFRQDPIRHPFDLPSLENQGPEALLPPNV